MPPNQTLQSAPAAAVNAGVEQIRSLVRGSTRAHPARCASVSIAMPKLSQAASGAR